MTGESGGLTSPNSRHFLLAFSITDAATMLLYICVVAIMSDENKYPANKSSQSERTRQGMASNRKGGCDLE